MSLNEEDLLVQIWGRMRHKGAGWRVGGASERRGSQLRKARVCCYGVFKIDPGGGGTHHGICAICPDVQTQTAIKRPCQRRPQALACCWLTALLHCSDSSAASTRFVTPFLHYITATAEILPHHAAHFKFACEARTAPPTLRTTAVADDDDSRFLCYDHPLECKRNGDCVTIPIKFLKNKGFFALPVRWKYILPVRSCEAFSSLLEHEAAYEAELV